MAMSWQSTSHPGVEMRHEVSCRSHSGGRCRCTRSYRARIKNAEGRWRYAETVDSEEKALAQRQQNRDGQTPEAKASKPGRTLNSLFDEWLPLAKAGAVTAKGRTTTLSPGTLRIYAGAYRNHIEGDIGKRDATKLTIRDWQALLDAKVREGYKRKTIGVILAVVSAIYRWACSPVRALLPVNAVMGLELPAKDGVKRDRVATPEEAKALIAPMVDGDRVSYGLALYAGLRNCERRPLDWSWIDFKAGLIHVRVSKSKAGLRKVPIIAPLRPILLAEHMRLGRPKSGLVCTGPNGVAPKLESLRNRAMRGWGWKANPNPKYGQPNEPKYLWTKAREDALTPIGLHEARHSFATACAQAGIPLNDLCTLIGHEDVATTLTIYGHLYEGHELRAGKLLDGFFAPQATDELEAMSREELISLVRQASSMPHGVPHENGDSAQTAL